MCVSSGSAEEVPYPGQTQLSVLSCASLPCRPVPPRCTVSDSPHVLLRFPFVDLASHRNYAVNPQPASH